MALVNLTIPGLYGGVSQQVPELRFDTQVTEMVNCYPTVLGGVIKRPGTEVFQTDNDFPKEAFIYSYDRGDNESYLIAIINGYYRVYDLSLGIWTSNDWIQNSYLSISPHDTITTPKEAFSLTTVGDTTFITNKTKITAMNLSLTDDTDLYTSFIEMPRGYDILPGVTAYGVSRIFVIRGTLSISITAGTLGTKSYSKYLDIQTYKPLSENGLSISSKIKELLAEFNDEENGVFVSENMIQTTSEQPLSCTVTWDAATGTTEYSNADIWVDVAEAILGTKSVKLGALEGEHYIYTQNASKWDRIFYYWIKRTAGGSDSVNQPLRYTYKLYKDGSPTAYVSATSHDSTAAIVSLYNAIGSPFTNKSYKGSVLRVEIPDGHKLEGADSWGNQASESFLGKAKRIQDLPGSLGYNGAVFEITGDENTTFDNFYVRYQDGAYLETVRPGLINGFQTSSMPHILQLRRNSDGSYTNVMKEFEYLPRKCGDLNTASMPSFIGQAITDVFFYRNRLGFIAGDNVILSESGVYENFWPTTVTDIPASDPIDVAVDTNTVTTLQAAIPFNKDMLLIGNNAQFVLTSEQSLTPLDISIQQTTAYDAKNVDPIVIGPNVYFAEEKGQFSSIREYYIEANTIGNAANNITAHIPNYIPKNITRIVGSPKNDMMFVLSSDTPDTVYVYSFFFNGQEKVQSAWHKWVFEDAEVFDIQVMGNKLLLMTERADEISMEGIDLEFDLDIPYTNIGDTGGTRLFESKIILTKPGFSTGSEKVDDARGTFVIRNIQFNTTYGSFYNVSFSKFRKPREYKSVTNAGLYPPKDKVMTTTYGVVEEEGTVYPSLYLFPSEDLFPSATTYRMPSDNKYPIAGNADTIEIEITNKLPVGFRINSLDIVGIYSKNSRNV